MWANHCHSQGISFPVNRDDGCCTLHNRFSGFSPHWQYFNPQTVHHRAMVHLLLYGVIVPIFMQLVSSICVPVAVALQALLRISWSQAVEVSAFTSIWRSQLIFSILLQQIIQATWSFRLKIFSEQRKVLPKANFLLWNFSMKSNFFLNFHAIKGTYIPCQYNTYWNGLLPPTARFRLRLESALRRRTASHWNHVLWRGPSRSPRIWDCQEGPSVPFRDCWYVTHFRAFFCAALSRRDDVLPGLFLGFLLTWIMWAQEDQSANLCEKVVNFF